MAACCVLLHGLCALDVISTFRARGISGHATPPHFGWCARGKFNRSLSLLTSGISRLHLTALVFVVRFSSCFPPGGAVLQGDDEDSAVRPSARLHDLQGRLRQGRQRLDRDSRHCQQRLHAGVCKIVQYVLARALFRLRCAAFVLELDAFVG